MPDPDGHTVLDVLHNSSNTTTFRAWSSWLTGERDEWPHARNNCALPMSDASYFIICTQEGRHSAPELILHLSSLFHRRLGPRSFKFPILTTDCLNDGAGHLDVVANWA